MRVGLGAQLVPSFPGSDEVSLRPLIDVAIARGTAPFAFEAPDESFGFSLLGKRAFGLGPALNVQSSRSNREAGAPLGKVGTTVEVGGFAQYQLAPALRVRAEARKGLGGHEGWIGDVSADYVVRDGDAYLLSVGPRLSIADARYQHAYFGVTPAQAGASGLPAFTADGGIQSVGATAGYLQQLSRRWGIYSYVQYDRLVGDAAQSPIVRQLGSRDQLSGGLALTYTFGGD